MRILAESLKRLYESNLITGQKTSELKSKGTITEEEYTFIIGG